MSPLPSRISKRAPLVGLGMLALLAGLWAGLLRIGWQWPPILPALPSAHGPLMISGFLGTLISLERAVALAALPAASTWARWTYAAPILTALGAVALLLGLPIEIGRGLTALGSLILVGAFGLMVPLRRTWDTVTMALGALLWLAGNLVWMTDGSAFRASFWWIGFLVFTIAGERLELARVLLIRRAAVVSFGASVCLLLIGLIASLVDFPIGVRLGGAGLIALGVWLLARDVARRTIRQSGLTRFIAACLLPGYVWLVFAGGVWLLGDFTTGHTYDAALHSVLLGFVFSMIFGHAPIILPAVLNTPIAFRPSFYAHLVLLHVSLVLRIAGDMAIAPSLRMWAGLLGAVAILVFMGNTIRTVHAGIRSARTEDATSA